MKSKQKWIDVQEQKPPLAERIFVLDSFENISMGVLSEASKSSFIHNYYPSGLSFSGVSFDGMEYFCDASFITYWAPLPCMETRK